jgi:phenylalanyl-tRNA synthetase beta chain
MKFTLSWLRDHLETAAPLQQIVDTLSSIGLEVESVHNPAERLKGFVIARVLKAEPHPNADKLRVCQVDTGTGTFQVVCGAPNARTGLVGVFAPEGTYIPGTDFTLGKAKIRGVESNGMLCSERELELSQDHDGIIDLPEAMADQLGKPYTEVMGLDDPVVEVKVTPNRPDALSIRGIARDLAACGLGTLKKEDTGFSKPGLFDCPVPIELKFPNGDETPCPAFAGRYIKGVKNVPSPAWLQQRLKAIGLRPISALVDITNYITYDRGRPLHVYDAGKLKGTIHARLGKPGETFRALDGKDYGVDDTMTVIADDSGVLGLGGVIGGESTGCSETTVNVLIESAYFDPIRTAATGRKTGIRSDARYRFERGIDAASLPLGLNLATKMILEICGGTPSHFRMAGAPPVIGNIVRFRPARVGELTGLDVPATDSQRILKALGFTLEGKGENLTVTAPSFRPDIGGEADLVEEVIRIVGIDKVPATAMARVSGVSRPVMTEGQKRVRRARRVLAARGLVEAVTWSFIGKSEAMAFGGGAEALEVANPISSEMTDMRPSLLPGLLAALKHNLDRGYGDHALFEIGQAYRSPLPEGQMILASGVRTGLASASGIGRHWETKATEAGPFDVKADAGAVLAIMGLDINRIQITRDAPAWFHPGRSGAVRLGPKVVLAHFGELHPETLKALGLDDAAMAFELFLDAVPPAKKKPTRAKPPLEATDLQSVRRDFAFVLDRSVAASDVVRAAEGVDRKLITGVSVFDLFEGGNIGEGKKSLAIEVTLQPRDKAMTAEEIDAVAGKIIAQVKKATGGEVRS